MADIIGLAASAAGGGVFGLLGTVIGRIAGLIERRQENTQEQVRWKHESALVDLQMKARASELSGQESLAQTAGALARARVIDGGGSGHRRQLKVGERRPGH